jgi:hypothetical protein
MSDTKIEKLILDLRKTTEEACSKISSAALDARKDIASEAESAKNVLAKAATEAAETISEKNNSTSSIWYKQVSLGISVISFAGVVVGGYLFMANPTRDNDTALQLQDQRITAQRETIDSLTKTAQNHTVEINDALDRMEENIEDLNINIATLEAIINERIPAKK